MNMDQLKKPIKGDGSPSPVLRHIAPTTQTSYVTANASPKPSPKLSHAQVHPNFSSLGLSYQVGGLGSTANSTSPSVVNSPKLGEKSRLPSYSKAPPGFGQASFGFGEGTTSPGLLSNNVSFVSAEQYLRNNGPPAENSGYPAHPGLVRSRRSSVALAVSVSLASRSRSRTPVQKIGSPPTSPSRRMSREIGGGQPMTGLLGQVAENQPAPTPHKGNKWMKGPGEDIEFADFGWDEAFEDDEDDELASVSRRSGRKSQTGKSMTKSPEGQDETGLEVEIQNMEFNEDSEGEDREDDVDDIFPPGHRLGEGLSFQGETIEEIDPVARSRETGRSLPQSSASSIASLRENGLNRSGGKRKVFEVVRKLGSGSYAVVYLVKEVGGGQEYALKCLSKRDLEDDALHVQLFEATIHLSLPRHQNIVTLYQTLQTKKWLFLLLEMCPGEDLFYWLEHSRDSPPHSAAEPQHNGARIDIPENHPNGRAIPLSSSNLPSSAVPFSTSAMISGMGTPHGTLGQSPIAFSHRSHFANEFSSPYHHTSNAHAGTPTTPSLLSAYSANALLSSRRLKLIASMFAQMCEAVALCHDIGVSHRDIKPENFICCDSQELAATRDDDDLGRKKVIVKLTDFGLATTDETSGDVECGSRPYMAYECRNELGPNYQPRPADVWSLGVVLLNMLFHRNPWTDPVPGNKNFDNFMEDPINFLLDRFTGIGREVATYLAERVFNVKIENRTSARDFGRWARHLPSMIGGKKAVSALRLTYLNSNGSKDRDPLDFKKSPIEPRGASSALSISHTVHNGFTPSSNQANTGSDRHTSHVAETLPEVEEEEPASKDRTPQHLAAPLDTLEESMSPVVPMESNIDSIASSGLSETTSASGPKRKKRGTRSKNKAASLAAAALMAGMPASRPYNPMAEAVIEKEAVLRELAAASQSLAREISKATKSPQESVIDLDEFPKLGDNVKPGEIKKSKWKALMSMSNGNPELQALARKVQERDAGPSPFRSAPAKLQHVDHSISSGQMTSLSGSQSSTATPGLSLSPTSQVSTFNPTQSLPGPLESDNWRRAPSSRDAGVVKAPYVPNNSMTSLGQAEDERGRMANPNGRPRQSGSHSRTKRYDSRDMSPVPTLGWSYSSGPSSVYSQSTRDGNSIYSAFSASSSTLATTSTHMSSGSNTSNRYFPKTVNPPGVPRNVKQMDGVPWEVNELPRQHRVDRAGNMPEGDIFTRPPMPKKISSNKVNRPILESISEKPSFYRNTTSSSNRSGPQIQSQLTPLGESPSESGFSTITRTETHLSTTSNKQTPNASSSPAKLKMQIASLGKMLSGLKTGRGRD